MERYIDTLVRHKRAIFLPLLITPLIALVALLAMGGTHQVSAVGWVERNPVGINLGDDESGNQVEAQRLEEWLSTEVFRRTVMDRVGLTGAVERGEWPVSSGLESFFEENGLTRVVVLGQILDGVGLAPPESTGEAMFEAHQMIRSSLSASAEGNNILKISYSGREPHLGKALIESTIAVYRERSALEVEQNLRFYSEQAQIQEQRLNAASAAVQAFLRERPVPPGTARPAEEQAQLDTLERQLEAEQSLYNNALETLEQVRIDSTLQGERFRIVDPPEVPSSLSLGLREIVFTTVLGLVFGGAIAAAAVVLLTWMDPTVRSKADVVAVVPEGSYMAVPLLQDRGRRFPHIGRLLANRL